MIYLTTYLAWMTWNPDRVAFYVPYLNHPVVWYGLLFASGFLLAYLVGVRIFLYEAAAQDPVTKESIVDQNRLLWLAKRKLKRKSNCVDEILPAINQQIENKTLPFQFFSQKVMNVKKQAIGIADQLTTYLVLGLIIGARLGYIFFYGWPEFKANPTDILMIWKGGLASHGACIGVLLGLMLFIRRSKKKRVRFNFLQLLDILAIICGVLACCIRLGNFVNQEIIGTATQLPWGVIFLSPMDGGAILPRHPVQLYEAFFYAFLAIGSYWLWKTNKLKIGSGALSGLVLATLFTFRFCIEFVKEHQGIVVGPDLPLQMGQILSLPFIAFGLALCFRAFRWRKQYKKSQLKRF